MLAAWRVHEDDDDVSDGEQGVYSVLHYAESLPESFGVSE